MPYRLSLFTHPHHDGEPVRWLWDLIGWQGRRRSWVLSWHHHSPKCRYGWYSNFTNWLGLVAALNIPLIGDFSLTFAAGRP